MPERCIDASVAIKWVDRREPWRKKARQLLNDSVLAGFVLVAPPLFEYEVESALQTMVARGLLTEAEADRALTRLAAVGVQLVSPPGLVVHARALARRFNQPKIYDSVYAALAELRGCEFWTADKAFYDAVKTGLSYVKYLPDYP